MNIYEQLVKAGAKVTYFCAYCGYEFEDPPKLPVKCPHCSRELANFSKPVVEPAKPRTALQKRQMEKDGVRGSVEARERRRSFAGTQ